jgi:hypothetical protein
LIVHKRFDVLSLFIIHINSVRPSKGVDGVIVLV